MPILTPEMLEAGISDHGAFNLAQLKIIVPAHEFTGTGGTWSLQKGWKRRLIGTLISQENYEQFLKLKNKHLDRRNKLAQQKANQLTLVAIWESKPEVIPEETDLYPSKQDVIAEEEDILSHLASVTQESR